MHVSICHFSKAKRKRKREEAEKLPEVSQDMYYNITTDLKEIFQSLKTTDEKEEDMPWSEDGGREETGEISNSATLTNGTEQTSGFTFSFFDSDTKGVKEGIFFLSLSFISGRLNLIGWIYSKYNQFHVVTVKDTFFSLHKQYEIQCSLIT